MIIFAKDHGVIPGGWVARELNQLFASLAQAQEPVTVVIDPGTYHLDAKDCPKKTLRITNTVGAVDPEGALPPHVIPVGLCLENLNRVTLLGKGARFVMHGKLTNAAVLHCRDLVIDGIAITHDNPDFHEFSVVDKTAHTVDYRLDAQSRYEKRADGNFDYVGYGYRSPILAAPAGWDCAHMYRDGAEAHYIRTHQPFRFATDITELEDHLFRVSYPDTEAFNVGEHYGVYNCKRRYNGIFIDGSSNVTLRGIAQHFNFALAVVAQDSENISVCGCTFAPEKGSVLKTASCADFIQMCMCKGQMTVTDNYFCGAGDDVINVHGVHFLIEQIEKNRLVLVFPHNETCGFLPIHTGDRIEYVDPETLLCVGEANVMQAELTDERHITVLVDSTAGARAQFAVEDATMCPDLYFARNTMTRIVTRGMLITTRGKVVVEDNLFSDVTDDHILISDDAGKWYESGCVRDVTIRRNCFDRCGAYYIEICPENRKHGGAVHSNIAITDNLFTEYRGIFAKSTENLTLRGNIHPAKQEEYLQLHDVSGLDTDADL